MNKQIRQYVGLLSAVLYCVQRAFSGYGIPDTKYGHPHRPKERMSCCPQREIAIDISLTQ